MSEQEQKRRGPSSGSKNAALYLKLHPNTKAKELATKFDIDISTIYRSKWWRTRETLPQEVSK